MFHAVGSHFHSTTALEGVSGSNRFVARRSAGIRALPRPTGVRTVQRNPYVVEPDAAVADALLEQEDPRGSRVEIPIGQVSSAGRLMFLKDPVLLNSPVPRRQFED